MNHEEAKKIMAILTAAFHGTTLPNATIAIWYKFLSDISYEVGYSAILHLISTCEFFPKISNLRQAIVKMLPDEIPSTEEAWLEVSNQIRATGSYGTPRFSNDLIGKAVNALGWRELCLSENIVANRAHFLKIYASFRDREIEDNLQLPEIKRLKESIRLQIESKEVKQISTVSEILKDYRLEGK